MAYALDVGGVIFEVGESRLWDLTEVLPRRNRADILQAYSRSTGDHSSGVRYEDCLEVVLRAVELAWYRASGRTVPPVMLERFNAAKEKARMTTATKSKTEKPKKGERITVKSVITQGLLAGKDGEKILADVKRFVPKSVAGPTHIAYYKSKLVTSGELKKAPRKTAPPKTTSKRVRKAAKK